MSESGIWWMVAGTIVALELLSGTFFLLLVAGGLAAGAVAAHLGVALATQFVVAAIVGGGSVGVWAWLKRRNAANHPDPRPGEVQLDVGAQISVLEWRADGTGTAQYRGAAWTVIARPGSTLQPGLYRVAEVVGSRLSVENI